MSTIDNVEVIMCKNCDHQKKITGMSPAAQGFMIIIVYYVSADNSYEFNHYCRI
ncbi:hypothetical protein [Candidatus Nitrosocosmicus sp. SS]|uniref:hypothetical protein n=1 Tax=Candidatus Nitrosocosmicus agrestis TaxID=2563600 RepID=UPI0018A853CC|nr:hypothetical protein [Candidatus Nitrosocosmicus sp. SS]